MIDILQKHLALLPEVEKWSEKDNKEGYTGKRKIVAIQENYDNDQAHESTTQQKHARVPEEGVPANL